MLNKDLTNVKIFFYAKRFSTACPHRALALPLKQDENEKQNGEFTNLRKTNGNNISKKTIMIAMNTSPFANGIVQVCGSYV